MPNFSFKAFYITCLKRHFLQLFIFHFINFYIIKEYCMYVCMYVCVYVCMYLVLNIARAWFIES